MSDFTIGCDPELFVVEGDQPVSAHDLIPGTKKEPYPVKDGGIQVDGLAVEMNTNPVASSNFAEFNARVVSVMGQLKAEIRKKYPTYNFSRESVVEFSKEYLDTLPDTAKELGCDPDYDAYTGLPNPRPDGSRLFRTAAGHLHVGWGSDIPVDNEEHIAICADFIKMLDATVGLVMTYIDREPRRRELYGKAGAFRPKSYGVEYRTPSNAWLFTKPRRYVVWDALNVALRNMMAGSTVEQSTGHTPEVIQAVINTGDWQAAKEILVFSRRPCGKFSDYVRDYAEKEFPNAF